MSTTDPWTISAIRPFRAGIGGYPCAEETESAMSDGTPAAKGRERGGRARRQREAQRSQPIIAGVKRKIPTYELLGEEGLARIEAAADAILQDVGMDFRGDDEALRLWRGAGADVDGERVRFPAGLLRSILRSAPH